MDKFAGEKAKMAKFCVICAKKGHRLEKSAQPPPVVINISYAIDFEVPHKLCNIALPLFNLLQMCGEILSLKNQKILSFPKIPSSFLQRRPPNPYNWRHSSCKFSRGLPALALFLCSYQEIQFHCHLFITMIVAIVIITIITVIFITNLITFDKTRPYSTNAYQCIFSFKSKSLEATLIIAHSNGNITGGRLVYHRTEAYKGIGTA